LKISIITVCYNSDRTIRETIESVLSQSYRDVEYIIVDGASTDGTLSVIDEFSAKIDKVISEPDSGIYDAMNKGLAQATGEVVGILNSDDVFNDCEVIEDVAGAFRRGEDLDMVFGDVLFVQSDDLSKAIRYYSCRNFRPWKLRFGWMPPHPGAFIRRSLYQRYGLYRQDYEIAADYEMFVRWFKARQVRFATVDRVLVRMRTGGVSTSGVRSSITLNREIVRACRTNGVYTNLAFVLSKVPFKLLELFRRPDCHRHQSKRC